MRERTLLIVLSSLVLGAAMPAARETSPLQSQEFPAAADRGERLGNEHLRLRQIPDPCDRRWDRSLLPPRQEHVHLALHSHVQ